MSDIRNRKVLQGLVMRLRSICSEGTIYSMARDAGFPHNMAVSMARGEWTEPSRQETPFMRENLLTAIVMQYPGIEDGGLVVIKTRLLDGAIEELEAIARDLHEAMVRNGITSLSFEKLNMQIDTEIANKHNGGNHD